MTRPQSPNIESLAVAELELIVAVCDRFESAWRSGPRPAIESFLQDVACELRPHLLLRLLQLESELRQRTGEIVDNSDYLARFPDLAEVVEAALSSGSRHSQTGAALARSLLARVTAPLDQCGANRTPVDWLAGPVPGQVVGEYELIERIGQGGMGAVFRARQRCAGGRIVALKIIRPDLLCGLAESVREELLQRFQEEVRAAAGIEHEHIVPLYEAGQANGQPYYSMRFIDGKSLADLLRSGPIPGPRAVELLSPVALAVHHLHLQGILHRDIKPHNLLMDDSGRLLLTDFGLAKRLAHLAAEATLSKPMLGTPAYMSPEQARGTGRIGAASDVYSLGATLYEMLTGRPPFQAPTPVETLRQVLDEDPLPPRRLIPVIDADLERICLQCLRKEPAQRYPSAQALANDLTRFSAGQRVQAKQPTWRARTVKWSRRRPILATLLLVFATCVPGFIAYLIWQDLRFRRNRVDDAIKALLSADLEAVPALAEELYSAGRWTESRLRDLWLTIPPDSPARFRIALALMRFRPAAADTEEAMFLLEQFPAADPAKLRVICDAFASQRADLTPRFWRTARDPHADLGRRLRCACFLAAYEPDADGWPVIGADVAAGLVKADPAEARGWAALLAPVVRQLKEPLFAHYQDRARAIEARIAAVVLAEQNAGNATVLTELIQDAEPEQFQYVVSKLLNEPVNALSQLHKRWKSLSQAKTTDSAPTANLRQRANLASAILRLDPSAEFWHLLRLTPGVHTPLGPYLIQTLGPMGIDRQIVVQRIMEAKDTSIRVALILALGEFPDEHLPQAWKEQQASHVVTMFQSDPDPAIHSASEWLLRRWGRSAPELETPGRGGASLALEGMRWYVTKTSHTMAVIENQPAGMLGSPANELGHCDDENVRPFAPAPFAIATKETTVAQFRAYRADDNTQPAQRPVTSIDFHAAAGYCNWLSRQEGIPKSEHCYAAAGRDGFYKLEPDFRSRIGYRLPTEEEWEYACRAGTVGRWFCGEAEELLRYYAWHQNNSRGNVESVGQLKPNAFGLFDTLGNAAEWCIHAKGTGPLGQQVIRGGSARFVPRYMRAAYRQEVIPTTVDGLLGFRVARSLPAPTKQAHLP